jgi:DNA-binding GntR family transcriptional regulator
MKREKRKKSFVVQSGADEVPPVALYQHVYSELRRGLLDGLFRPGETISLRSIANELGTSPMPARDAVRRLITESALELLPNRSVIVPTISRQRFKDLIALRIELEGAATEDAVRANAAAMIGALREIENRAAKSRLQRMAENITVRLANNRQFHFTIYNLCGNALRVSFIELLWLQSAPLTHMSFVQSPARIGGKHHQVLIEAVAAGESEKARQAIERDIRDTADHILAFWRFPDDEPFDIGERPKSEKQRRAAGAKSRR